MNFDEIEEINHRVNRNITYRVDRVNYLQSPQETMVLGAGDCEDIANLKHSRIPGSYMQRCWAPGSPEAHMVCVVKVKRRRCIFGPKRDVELVLDSPNMLILEKRDTKYDLWDPDKVIT